jgi:hypothetical protein
MNDSLISQIPNVFSEDLCKDIIKKFDEDSRKQRGYLVQYNRNIVDTELKNSTELFISSYDDWSNINTRIAESITECVNIYLEELLEYLTIKTNLKDAQRNVSCISNGMFDRGYVISKIDQGNGYPWHNDSVATKDTPSGYRGLLSIITYLNTITEGGETKFIDGFVAKPEAGKSLVLPATWNTIHTGSTVLTNESKYICVTLIFSKS